MSQQSEKDFVLEQIPPRTERLWALPFLGQSLDVMVPSGAVDVGGKVVYPHPPSGRLPGFGGGRQFMSDVLSSAAPEQGGVYSGHQIYEPMLDPRDKATMSPKEAQAFFLAKSVMNDMHRKGMQLHKEAPIPANAHWVGMSKDSHGEMYYADASGTLFDKKDNRLIARPKKVHVSNGFISIDALRKAYQKAGKYLKTANKPILHMKMKQGAVSRKEKSPAITSAPKSVSSGPVKHAEGVTAPDAAQASKAELRKAAATLSQIASSLKVRKPHASNLAAVAKELADVSSRLGATILAHDGASRRALADYLKQAKKATANARGKPAADAAAEDDSVAAPRPARSGDSGEGTGGLGRELRIEMDLHSRLFGRHGLCARGAFRRSAVCQKLAVSPRTASPRRPGPQRMRARRAHAALRILCALRSSALQARRAPAGLAAPRAGMDL